MSTYLTWKEVLARLGVTHPTLWRWCKDGHFPKPVRLSPGRIAFREEDIQAWEANREVVEHGRG